MKDVFKIVCKGEYAEMIAQNELRNQNQFIEKRMNIGESMMMVYKVRI